MLIVSKHEWKFDTILDLYQSIVVAQSVVFVNSKGRCRQLVEDFNRRDFTAVAIHGEMPQEERDRVMEDFRQGKIRVLLSTDLTGRGIDVPGISLVVNYELPHEKSQYIHRVGRTGRFGKKGVAINLLGGEREKSHLKGIEEFYATIIPELPSDFKTLLS